MEESQQEGLLMKREYCTSLMSPHRILSNFSRLRLSDSAIEDIAVEDSARMIAVAALGRVYIYEIKVRELGECNLGSLKLKTISVTAPLNLVIVDPPASDAPHPALCRSMHFFNGGRSVFAGFLDSKELSVNLVLI